MRADAITRDCLTYLKQNRGRYLRVHSVFQRAINLVDDNNQLLAILDNTKDQGAISLQLDFDTTISAILPGDLAEITNVGLEFLRGGPVIDIKGIKPDNLTIQMRRLCTDPVEMVDRYNKLRRFIIEEGSMDGLAPLIDQSLPQNNYCNFVADNLSDLVSWMEQNQVKKFRNGLSGVLGFGPGLTPSTDDFLTGLMLVAFVLRKDHPNPIFDVLLKDLPKIALGKTTLISEEMIRLAALGKTSNSYKSFVTGFFGRNPGNVRQLAKQVIKTGASSGTDFLYGIYASQTMVINLLGGKNAESSSQKE